MTASLNHTIVYSNDKKASAHFLTELFGLPEPVHAGPFAIVQLAGGLSLDYMDLEGEIALQHYAFLVSEAEFDAILGRIRERGMTYWADSGRTQPGEINHWDDGRGLYFDDPDGHLLEIITRPYGSGGRDAAHPNPLFHG